MIEWLQRIPRWAVLSGMVVILAASVYTGLAVSSSGPLAPWHWWLGLARSCGVVDGTQTWLRAGAPQTFEDCGTPGCSDEYQRVCRDTHVE